MPGDEDEEPEPYLLTETAALKLVSDYTHLDFNAALELDCFTYKILLKDAFIDKMSKTKEGREYLEDCWILSQTMPDRKSLRKKFKET